MNEWMAWIRQQVANRAAIQALGGAPSILTLFFCGAFAWTRKEAFCLELRQQFFHGSSACCAPCVVSESIDLRPGFFTLPVASRLLIPRLDTLQAYVVNCAFLCISARSTYPNSLRVRVLPSTCRTAEFWSFCPHWVLQPPMSLLVTFRDRAFTA